ncbi:complement C1q-like protein 4 isoform X2 [Mercenaria mercenaria]|uniref:complement C1q-like protein 4 isoform X2 n=1 Tax=Mercenaria mercenaria TaxID=6596 RepID=UPI001E1D605C|nr:complement C1q-like protein 4 isoform X2 [Mercenaria mercenaria]
MFVPHRRQQQTNTFVTFSAGLTKMVNLTTNTSVAFDRVWINLGNGYNNNTGIFTCPHAGVYVFIYHGLSQYTGQMWLDLYKNGAYEVTAYAHNTVDYASASNAILLSLKLGDQVYIRGHGSSHMYGHPEEVYATFSGFILIPDQGQ